MRINEILRSTGELLLDSPPRELLFYLQKRFTPHYEVQGLSEKCPCIFVLSTGRTGTKTLAILFSLSRNVYAFHEPKPKLYSIGKLIYENFDHIKGEIVVQEILRHVFLEMRQDKFRSSFCRRRVYVETSPQTTFLAPIILKAVPDVKFIHLVRDPREVVRSGMRRKWYDGHKGDQTRILPDPDSKAGKSWEHFDPFEKCLWLWNETNVWIKNFLSTLDSTRKLQLRSEDIFEGEEKTVIELFSFIGGPMPSIRRVRRVLGRKYNPQRAGEFPKSSKWSKEMLYKLEAIAGRTAVELGYEINC